VKTGPKLVASMKYCKDCVIAKLMHEEQMARMTTISPEIYSKLLAGTPDDVAKELNLRQESSP
jgi:hypothetical protein